MAINLNLLECRNRVDDLGVLAAMIRDRVGEDIPYSDANKRAVDLISALAAGAMALATEAAMLLDRVEDDLATDDAHRPAA